MHAHNLTELGAWLLASQGAALLAMSLSRDDRDPARPVIVWDAHGQEQEELGSLIGNRSYPFRPVLRAAEKGADALLLALAPRWPGSVPSRRFGIVTDGIGLGFCPDDPDPLGAGWAARRVRDRSLTCLLPFGPGHILSRASGPRG